MLRRFILPLAVPVALVIPAAPLAGQSDKPQPFFFSLDGKEPKRPKLEPGADTNDARAYIEWGHLRETPWKKSFDAYYWAYRLEPANQATRLNLRDAVVASQGFNWQREYWDGAEFVIKSRQSKLLDTLNNLVFYREPFANLFYDRCIVDRDWLDYLEGNAYWTADHYYSQGCYTQAAEWFGKLLAKSPTMLTPRLNLVRSLHWTNRHAEALVQLDTALAQLRARDAKRTYRFYVSKEQLETMRGEIYEGQQDYHNAKLAYAKALEENLAYWPAHMRLARVALVQGSIDEALQEYDQVLQLVQGEPVPHLDYGYALLQAKRPADAEKQFRRAIELEPYWALSYYNLAVSLDNQGKKEEAAAAYRDYLARAPKRNAKFIAHSNTRLAELTRTAGTR